MAKILFICRSNKKGQRKRSVAEATLVKEHGMEGDAHAGPGHRQVSLLGMESIQKMLQAGLQVGPGDFAENLTTQGLVLYHLPVGTHLRIGATALGEVTQIGKECHNRCAIFHQAGDCVMPREGIFIRVVAGGVVRAGDEISIIEPEPTLG